MLKLVLLCVVAVAQLGSTAASETASETASTRSGSTGTQANTRFNLGGLIGGITSGINQLAHVNHPGGFNRPGGFNQPGGFNRPGGFPQPGGFNPHGGHHQGGIFPQPGGGINVGVPGVGNLNIGQGGIALTGQCNYCRSPFGGYRCCKAGTCPAVRPSCPPTRNFGGPPQPCFDDSTCAGIDKCCPDTCLGETVCKAPIEIAAGG